MTCVVKLIFTGCCLTLVSYIAKYVPPGLHSLNKVYGYLSNVNFTYNACYKAWGYISPSSPTSASCNTAEPVLNK